MQLCCQLAPAPQGGEPGLCLEHVLDRLARPQLHGGPRRNSGQHWGHRCAMLRGGLGAHSMVQAAQQPQRQVLADAHVAVEGHAWIHAGTGELVDDVLCTGRLSIVRQRRNSCVLGRRQQDMPKAPWCPDGRAQPLTSPARMA